MKRYLMSLLIVLLLPQLICASDILKKGDKIKIKDIYGGIRLGNFDYMSLDSLGYMSNKQIGRVISRDEIDVLYKYRKGGPISTFNGFIIGAITVGGISYLLSRDEEWDWNGAKLTSSTDIGPFVAWALLGGIIGVYIGNRIGDYEKVNLNQLELAVGANNLRGGFRSPEVNIRLVLNL